MSLVLVEKRDVRRLDLIADSVCLCAVVARTADCGSRLFEEPVVAVAPVCERGDPLRPGAVEDEDRFVLVGAKFLGGDQRVDDPAEALSQLGSGEYDERCLCHQKV